VKWSRHSRRRRLVRLVIVVVVVGMAAAAVWIAATRGAVPGMSTALYPIHYRQSIARVAKQYHLDPFMVAAVVKTESGYDPRARSSAGAVGLMQLMPDTATWITGLASWKGSDKPVLTDPDDNLELGACYLAFLLQRFGGDVRPALAAYNAGQGTVVGWVQAAGDGGSFDLSDIRFPETRTFVERVEHYQELYGRLYPHAFAGVAGAA
jgi:soluble lytic murein transglycosylase